MEEDSRHRLKMLLVWKLWRSSKRRRKSRSYVRPINRHRLIEGEFATLVSRMQSNPHDHFAYFRMSAMRFEDLLRRVGPFMPFHPPTHEMPISNKQRLAITIRYLASGDTLTGIAFSYRIGFSTATIIVQETTEAIWRALYNEFLALPNRQRWQEIAQKFWENWNFPMCQGALDGKHIAIENQPHAMSMYFNYKGFYSVVLLALVDAGYNFILVDVGGYGSENDSGLHGGSRFRQNRMQMAA